MRVARWAAAGEPPGPGPPDPTAGPGDDGDVVRHPTSILSPRMSPRPARSSPFPGVGVPVSAGGR